MSRLVPAALCAWLIASPIAGLQAQTTASAATPIKATVDQLGFIAGAWTGKLGDRTVEQHWSAPLAGSIVAMYRSIANDKPTLYELLAIEQEGEHVMLRIKHFNPGPGLAGREAKDEAINHVLVKVGDRTAVFQGTGADNPPRVTFTSPDARTLTIVVERLRDGKPAATEFKYSRIGS